MTKCIMCGKDKYSEYKQKTKDGYICEDCLRNLSLLTGLSLDQRKYLENCSKYEVLKFSRKMRDLAKEKEKMKDSFHCTRTIVPDRLQVDDQGKVIKIAFDEEGEYEYLKFDQILSYEMIDDNRDMMKGGVGRAVVGGLLFGSTGAIVGAQTRKSQHICSSLYLNVYLKNTPNPFEKMEFITQDVNRYSNAYTNKLEEAKKAALFFDYIIKLNENQTPQQSNNAGNTTNQLDIPDQIRKYKALADDGIITQEEFEAAKKKLLSL